MILTFTNMQGETASSLGKKELRSDDNLQAPEVKHPQPDLTSGQLVDELLDVHISGGEKHNNHQADCVIPFLTL